MIVIIAILAALVVVFAGAAYGLWRLLCSERRIYAVQVAEYARRDARNTELTKASMDRRFVLDGSVPLDESLREEPKEEQTETIEDVQRLLAEEETGGSLLGVGKIANRRLQIQRLRDLEDAEAHPTPRTIAQPMPYDPTANVDLTN